MGLLKRVRKFERCPKCKSKYNIYAPKPHVCHPARDREEPPENRPELHHRADLRAAVSPKRKNSKQLPPTVAHGTAIIDILLPKDAPPRNIRLVKKRKGKSEQEHLDRPEPESKYESPQDIRNMDHTKDYAHAFRDGGQFGSHPSYDGFDDESNP